MGKDWDTILERTTPLVLGALAVLFAGFTAFIHLDPGRTPAAATPTTSALKGREQWHQGNCSTCHQIYGLGGYLGPDLTNVYSRRGEGFLRFVLANGYGAMPKPALDQQGMDELVEYLKYVDTSGRYPQTPSWPLKGLPN